MTAPLKGTVRLIPKPGRRRTAAGGAQVVDLACVARRAFALFQERGGQHGRDVEDWLEAERELMAERPAQVSSGVN